MSTHKLFLTLTSSEPTKPYIKEYSIKLCTSEDEFVEAKMGERIVSPIFPFKKEGVSNYPDLKNRARISFLSIQEIFPKFKIIEKIFDEKNILWFSIGLVNLVIIEEGDSLDKLEEIKSLTGCENFETWVIEDNKIVDVNYELKKDIAETHNLDVRIPEVLPIDIRFIVSEFLMSSIEIMSDAKIYIPQYVNDFEKIFNAGRYLVNDLASLFGDSSYTKSSALEKNYSEKNKTSLINDRLGRLVQLNSALTYVQTQTFGGKIPLLSNNAQIKGYSLLGIGVCSKCFV